MGRAGGARCLRDSYCKVRLEATSTRSLGRHTCAGLAEKGGATGRLAGHLAASRPSGAGQRQACPASAAFVDGGNILEGMTLAPSLKGAEIEEFRFQRQDCLPMAARQQSMRVPLGNPAQAQGGGREASETRRPAGGARLISGQSLQDSPGVPSPIPAGAWYAYGPPPTFQGGSLPPVSGHTACLLHPQPCPAWRSF